LAEIHNDTSVEYLSLELLADEVHPVGSPRLAVHLNLRGVPVSEATAGRILRNLDQRGWTQALSKRGRVLTSAGRERFEELRRTERFNGHSSEMRQAVDVGNLDALLDLLRARRAIEPEAARLAAERATPDERRRISSLSREQTQRAEDGQSPNEVALDFHRLVVEASHNRMLTAMARVLLDSTNDPMGSILDQMSGRRAQYPHLAHDHHAIQEAICNGDPDTAEREMRAHLDTLIRAVEEFRFQVQQEEQGFRSRD
jgi:GntR family transcriptional regulator, transcriptional repressor for pyruvate dehydrogenase complex